MSSRTLYRSAVLLFFSAAQVAFAGQVTIPGTHLQFQAPDNFTVLDKEELDIKFPSKRAPRQAIGNERRTTTIAYDLRDLSIDDQALARQIDAIGDTMGRAIPGYVSIDRGMRTINGRQWAYFEMGSTALDADIHNIVLMSAYEGRLVALNFNSTASDFPLLEEALRASISTLKDQPSLDTPELP